METKKEKFIWFAGITPQERQKLRELTELYKGVYNNPRITFSKVIETLIERIGEFEGYNLKKPIDNDGSTVLTLYIEKEEFYNRLIELTKQKLRDKSNLIRWLINVAYEIEFKN